MNETACNHDYQFDECKEGITFFLCRKCYDVVFDYIDCKGG